MPTVKKAATVSAENAALLEAETPELPAEFEGMTLQQIQLAIAKADLQAKLLDLDRIRDENQKRINKAEAIKRFNEQIQADIKSQQQLMAYAQSVCRHRQGGKHQNVWAGDGKPCVTRTQMLDGFTWLLQCTRCRLKVFTPHPSMMKKDPEGYRKQNDIFQKLWEMSGDSGLDEIRGPTFTFMRDGVPYIPERM